MFSNRLYFLVTLWALFSISCAVISNDSFGGRAFVRLSTCREHLPTDDKHIKAIHKKIIPAAHFDKPKGYLGRVGILGGAYDGSGAVYFAAIAALRVGADEVNVYCNRPSAPAIQSQNPDINVHPHLDVSVPKLVEMITKNDVILIGPGLDQDQHSINTINTLIATCKTLKKPLVFDLAPFFLTQAFANVILNYPEPGIVLAMNTLEFEQFYPFIKAKDAFSDAHVHIDFTKLGEHTIIYRKGCTDSIMSANSKIVWSLSKGGSIRRCPGQGNVISGAIAAYFNWALNTLEPSLIKKMGSNVAASTATYSAAVMMRACNKRSYGELGKSALTSDMVKEIGPHLYGML